MSPDLDSGASKIHGGKRGGIPGPGGTAAAGAGPDPGPVEPIDAALRRRYAAYRRRQGSELLSLVPRAGLRPLYRAARARRTRGEPPARTPAEDAVGMLADFCADLLPLPPFEAWLADFHANRAAHLEEAGEGGAIPGSKPVTVELRRFADAAGRTWYASLDVRRASGAWRGSVAFHADDDERVFRTGEVFRESDATSVRTRFLDFDVATLRAFLRSVLP